MIAISLDRRNRKGMPLEKVETVPDGLRDGFLRIALEDLLSVNLTHLVSGLDQGDPTGIRQCGTVTSIMGYTEWIGEAPGTTISLGWDWLLEQHQLGGVTCVRIGLPRSNVMLVDAKRCDYGWNRNLQALATVVDAMPWPDQTKRAVQLR